jgi:putative tryptophan/tyrosine transport system substrate-binding protein
VGGKWLELLKEIAPGTSRVLVMFNPKTSPQTSFHLKSMQTAAEQLKLPLTVKELSNAGDISAEILFTQLLIEECYHSGPTRRDPPTRVGLMAIYIGRRKFITVLGSAVASWPLAARAQQPAGKLPTIGFLGATTASNEAQWTAAFVQRLGELGWIGGRTVAIEYRWAEGGNARYADFAAEFVRLKVNVIIAPGGAVRAVKQATSIIPIVFPVATDPVGSGFVDSLARPGGNATGLSLQGTDLVGKRIDLLREVLPNLHRLGIMANANYSAAVLEMGKVQAAAHTLNIEAITFEIRQADDIAPALEALKGGADALYVAADPLTNTNSIRINTLALGARLPTLQGFRVNLEAGGLMSYGANFTDLYRRSADFVDKILRGTKPADIPVEQPTKFELAINLKTAKVIGLKIPESFLVLADEVIE